MALLDDMKLVLRVSTDAYDSEVNLLIEAAKADMLRVGVLPDMVNPPVGEDEAPLVIQAIACYCKAHFGYDNSEAARFERSYRQTVTDLLNSSANIAAEEA